MSAIDAFCSEEVISPLTKNNARILRLHTIGGSKLYIEPERSMTMYVAANGETNIEIKSTPTVW